MAQGAKRICSKAGCNTLIDATEYRCSKHPKKMFEFAKSNANGLYSTARWKRMRQQVLNENPLCVDCQTEDVIKEATVVDHIVPHRGDTIKFFDYNNLQSLCVRHHTIKTARGE